MSKIRDYATRETVDINGDEYAVITDLTAETTHKINLSDYIVSVSSGVPGGGNENTFLRGDLSWQQITADAGNVRVTDNFEYSNNINCQAVLEDLDDAIHTTNQYLTPVGAVMAFANTCPDGWLVCDGSGASMAQYPELNAYLGGTYGYPAGGTTFTLPDLRGEFIRGFDGGRGVDTGRTIGSNQDDELKDHRHDLVAPGGTQYYVINDGNDWPPEGDGTRDEGPNKDNDAQWYSKTGYVDGSDGGIETRPRNMAMIYCIKY